MISHAPFTRAVNRRGVLVVIALSAAIAAPLPAQAPAPQPAAASFMEAFTLAVQALAAEEYERLASLLRMALDHAPSHPRALYHLARAEALSGRPTEALATLDQLASQGAVRNPDADTAFAALRGSGGFDAVRHRLAAAAAPVVRSDTAFMLPDPDFIPEGVAFDANGERFFVGSLHRGTIVEFARTAATREMARVAEGGGQVIGMKVDGPRRWLVAATLVVDSTAPRFMRGPGGWAALHLYDLDTDSLVARATIPDSVRPQLLNDVAITSGGDVYVSESEGGRLFRLPYGGSELELVYGGDGNFTYPNGVALGRGDSLLYVAHAEGMSVLQLGGARQPRIRLHGPAGLFLGAFDGLYACGAGLIGIQAMLDFQRVVWLELSPDGRSVTDHRVLEQRHPAHDAATTGAIVGDALYYVANAQLGRLQGDHSLAPAASPRHSVVLRLPLDDLCGP